MSQSIGLLNIFSVFKSSQDLIMCLINTRSEQCALLRLRQVVVAINFLISEQDQQTKSLQLRAVSEHDC